jgi:hypothetical protein
MLILEAVFADADIKLILKTKKAMFVLLGRRLEVLLKLLLILFRKIRLELIDQIGA